MSEVALSQPSKMSCLMKNIFHGKEIRTVIDDQGKPWFAAVDVCRAIGMKSAKNSRVGLNDSESQVVDLFRVGNSGTSQINGLANNNIIVISESGMYKVIMSRRSSAPEAKEFKDWVTADLLPSVLRAGSKSDLPVPADDGNKTNALPGEVRRRPALGFERLLISKAIRDAVSVTDESVRLAMSRRLNSDVRALAGRVKPGEPLLVDGFKHVEAIIKMVGCGSVHYRAILPELKRNPATRSTVKLLKTEKSSPVVPVVSDAHASFRRRNASAEACMGDMKIIVPAGMYTPTDIHERIDRWTNGALSISAQSVGLISTNLDMRNNEIEWQDHVAEYITHTPHSDRGFQAYKYSAFAVSKILEKGFELGALKQCQNEHPQKDMFRLS